MGWTEEKRDLVRTLWADGLSASQIAGEIGGVTRNAVIGVVHRMGLSGRVKVKPAGTVTKPTKRGLPTSRKRLGAIAKARGQGAPLYLVEAPTPEPVAPAEVLGIAFMDLASEHCRWPHGDGVHITFCGQPQQEGYSYCPHHKSLAYTKPPSPAEKKAKAKQFAETRKAA